MKTRQTVLGALTLLAAAQAPGVALADETHTGSHNGHSVSLISTGRIDDPFEDGLEHAAVLGTPYMYD
jgi:hypothetical protein